MAKFRKQMRQRLLNIGSFVALGISVWAFSACVAVGPMQAGYYDQAVQLAVAGQEAIVPTILDQACQAGSQPACDRTAYPVDFDRLPHVPIIQGVTTDRATILAILVPDEKPLKAVVWEKDRAVGILPAETNVYPIPDSKAWIWHLTLRGLDPAKTYHLQLVNKKEQLIDSRFFKALPIQSKKTKFALTSCMDDQFVEQKAMWTELLSREPQMILMIGDNVYTDSKLGESKTTPKILWNRYVETRSTLEVFRKKNLVPVFAVWDDHDFGMNDGRGETYPHVADSSKVFRAFFPRFDTDRVFHEGPGVFSELFSFGHAFYFLDDRTFRGPDAPDAKQTHFGQQQEEMLFRSIESTPVPSFIISGDQFWGGYHPFESYEGRHPQSFANFNAKLKKSKVRAVFLSGDRHLAEIIRIPQKALGYETFEITSSAIHAKTYPGSFQKNPSPNQIAGADGSMNYMMIESEVERRVWNLNVQGFGPQNKILFEKRLKVGK